MRYGIDFLQFTEQPRSIWGTNSAPEALRLMAYWTSYIGVGFYGANRPLFSEAGTLLFNPLGWGASLLLPAIAVAGFVWTRRWRYAPFFLLLLLVGVAIEVAGFPERHAGRDGMEWVYRNVPLRALHAHHAEGRAARGDRRGAGCWRCSCMWPGRACGAPRPRRAGPRWRAPWRWRRSSLLARAAAGARYGGRGAAHLEADPEAWTQAGRDLDRELPHNTRAVVLPGPDLRQLRLGRHHRRDPAARSRSGPWRCATRRRTRTRAPTTCSGRSTGWSAAAAAARPAGPLLRLMGAGAVVYGQRRRLSRSGAMNAAAAAEELARQGLAEPSRSYGPERSVPPAGGELGPGAELPQVRRYDVPPGRGLVSVAPAVPAAIVDGSAEGLAALAAFGALPDAPRSSTRAISTADELRRTRRTAPTW